MTLLALYWSIMIACYLIAGKLRRHKDRFHFLDKLTSFFIYLLIFLMGLRMGADEEVTSSLGSIGVQALFITFLTAVGSMLGGTAARKIVHLNRRALPDGVNLSAEQLHAVNVQRLAVRVLLAHKYLAFHAEERGGGVNTSGIKSSIIICLMVVCGMLLGYFVLPRLMAPERFEEVSSTLLVIGLCIMLGSVGFSMGLDGSIVRGMRGAGLGVVLVPIFSVIGSLLAGVVYAFLSPVTLREGLAISAGFGWYTMAPSVIASAGHTMASAVSFQHNVLREMLGIILLPVIAGKIGYIEAITIPGTASTDVCLPIVEQVCSSETVAYSFCTGMLMCITSAALVPIIIGA